MFLYTSLKSEGRQYEAMSNYNLLQDMTIRPATPFDAEFMAPLINQAGEGLPLATWASLARAGQSAFDLGLERIRGAESWISWQKAWIAQIDDTPAGVLVTYLHGAEMPHPDPDTPAGFVPLVELEALAPNSRYILILSTLAEHQGKGVGGALLAHAEALEGPGRMSLIVSDSNKGARRLYERVGYRAVDRRPMVSIPGWDSPGIEWILMIKDVD